MLRAPAAGALEADLVVVARLIDVIMAEDMTVAYYAAGAEHPASTPGSMELVPRALARIRSSEVCVET